MIAHARRNGRAPSGIRHPASGIRSPHPAAPARVSPILDQFGRRQPRAADMTRAHYDMAASNRWTDNHFADADDTDADGALRDSLQTQRNRTRHETRNSPYARGICRTYAADLVGTGPKLEIVADNPTADDEDRQGQRIERDFGDWAKRCDITGKHSLGWVLRLAVSQVLDSGEAVIALRTGPPDANGVTLRLQNVEPDRLQTPIDKLGQWDRIRDGIEFDANGAPVAYYILKRHPGDTSSFDPSAGFFDYDRVPAEQVIHLYDTERAGQTRGAPWLAPSTPLFAQLRRYTLATLSAAEIAADMAGVIETPSDDVDPDSIEAFDPVDIERGHLMTLPAGGRINQLKAEQPATNYPDFKREVLKEAGRPIAMPYNVTAGDSSDYNYASGRMDKQAYYKLIGVLQADWLGNEACDPIYDAWFREYALANPTPQRSHVWFWDGYEHVDPVKEAVAQGHRLENRTTTLAREYAREGRDWRREVDQIAIEHAYLRQKGLTVTEAAPAANPPKPANPQDEDEADEDDQ